MKQRVHLKSVRSSVERKLRDDLAFYHQGMPLDLLELYDEAKPIRNTKSIDPWPGRVFKEEPRLMKD